MQSREYCFNPAKRIFGQSIMFISPFLAVDVVFEKHVTHDVTALATDRSQSDQNQSTGNATGCTFVDNHENW